MAMLQRKGREGGVDRLLTKVTTVVVTAMAEGRRAIEALDAGVASIGALPPASVSQQHGHGSTSAVNKPAQGS